MGKLCPKISKNFAAKDHARSCFQERQELLKLNTLSISVTKKIFMRPNNFSPKNFTPHRAASVFSCAIWYDPDQGTAQWYHGWEDEIYALTNTLKVFSHPRSLRNLVKMLDEKADSKNRKYNPYVRAEIYENFTGQVIIQRTMEKVQDSTNCGECFAPSFVTMSLKIPGKHRVLDYLHAKDHHIMVPSAGRLDQMRNAYKFWMKHSKFATGINHFAKMEATI